MFRYGVCYSFNFRESPKRPKHLAETVITGKDFGLTLILNDEDYYHMRYGLTQSRGIVAVLSQPYTMPQVLNGPTNLSKFSIGGAI